MIQMAKTTETSSPPSRGPLFPDVGVVALVPDLWGSAWMARQHVMTRLARYFHVVWVDRPRHWREFLRANESDRRCFHSVKTPEGFEIYRPGPWFAHFYRPHFLGHITRQCRYAQAVRRLRARGCRKMIAYLWRPDFNDALDHIPWDISCYHLDDEYTFSQDEQTVQDRERRLLQRVNHVVVHSPLLFRKKRTWNSGTHLIPMGGDYHHFASPREAPEDLRAIPRPRIGYIGYIKGQLNFPLLHKVAMLRPTESFVFVGPMNANMRRYSEAYAALNDLPNVYCLGERHVRDLPAYMQHMDVLMLCYRRNGYTKYISPMKLQEYLATGRPILGTPIDYLRYYRRVVSLANTAEEWQMSLAYLLSPAGQSPDEVELRKGVAKLHDWSLVVQSIAKHLCETLGPSYTRQFHRACLSGVREIVPHRNTLEPIT